MNTVEWSIVATAAVGLALWTRGCRRAAVGDCVLALLIGMVVCGAYFFGFSLNHVPYLGAMLFVPFLLALLFFPLWLRQPRGKALLGMVIVLAGAAAGYEYHLLSTGPAVQPRNDLPGLYNFAQVSPGLYRGAMPPAEGFAQLKKLGVKTVINVARQHSDRDNLAGTGMGYVEIPCVSWQLPDENVVRFLKVATDPANQPVFVHCMCGMERTGMMVAAYRIIEQHWTVERAVAELHNFGFQPAGNDVADYLRHFDAKVMKAKVAAATRPDIEQIK